MYNNLIVLFGSALFILPWLATIFESNVNVVKKKIPSPNGEEFDEPKVIVKPKLIKKKKIDTRPHLTYRYRLKTFFKNFNFKFNPMSNAPNWFKTSLFILILYCLYRFTPQFIELIIQLLKKSI
jgi:hypothetical protein